MTISALRSSESSSRAVPVDGPHSYAVLIVDDDRAVRESLRFMLETVGFHVEAAADSDHAAQLLAEQAFDVVISDFSFPGGGRLWIHYVRRVQPAAAVIVVTGSELRGESAAALREEVSALLAKPVPAAELIGAIERATKCAPSERQLRYE